MKLFVKFLKLIVIIWSNPTPYSQGGITKMNEIEYNTIFIKQYYKYLRLVTSKREEIRKNKNSKLYCLIRLIT